MKTRTYMPAALRAALSIVLLTFGFATATYAQAPDEGAEEGVTPEAAPAEGATPEAAPTAPSGTSAIDPETLEVIPVDQQQQTPEGQTRLENIEVTGSRIKRTDYETAQPIAIIQREDIERTGLVSIADLIQDLPQAGAALGTTFNGFVDVGGVEIDLRNLGSNRVLVLVNGHRWVNGLRSLGTNVVDLSTIPISIVERIEVLKDGASAIYGSDAIAGVVNIITRKDFQGTQLRSYVGGYAEEGDGITQNHAFSWGTVADETSLFLDLSFTRQESIFAGDRKLTREPIYGTGVSRGSGNTPQGRIIFVPEDPATVAALNASDPNSCQDNILPAGLCVVTPRSGTDGSTVNEFRAFDPVNDPYNFAPENYLMTPYSQAAMFSQIRHQFLENLEFRAEVLYNRRRSQQRSAHMPILVGDLGPPPFSTLYVDATNPYNPFGQDIGRGVGGALTPGSGIIGRRPLEYGPRLFTQDVDTMRAGFALGGPFELAFGDFAQVVDWEAGYSYAESKEKEVTTGLFNLSRMRLAVGPLLACEADPEGCVPLNLFGGQGEDGRGTITREMLDYISYISIGSTRTQMDNVFANASMELFDLPAGPLGLAIGAELRQEDYQQIPDPLVAAGTSSNNQSDPTAGGYDSKEAFVEFAVPILKDQPWADELDLSVASRWSDYGPFGKADTYKFGLRWKPIDDLLVRGTVSTAFRAPSVGELFLGTSQSFPGIVDPCSADVRGDNPNREANCAEVPPQNVQTAAQLVGLFMGNPNLKPETADTFTAGFVYSPEYVPDLNIYVDWYSIDVDDYITVVGEQAILDYCYDSPPDQRAFCQYVNRDEESGVLQSVENPFLNFARLKTEGVDMTADYLLPWLKEFGRFKVTLDATYLTKYDLLSPTTSGGTLKDPDATPGRHSPAAFAIFPRVKANIGVAWSLDQWFASWSMRYIGAVKESCNDQVFTPTLRDLGLCSHPDPNVDEDDPTTPLENEHITSDESENELEAKLFHHVQAGLNLPEWTTKVTFGINNLLNDEPPPSYAFVQNPSYEIGGDYELPGRFMYLRLEKEF